MNHDASVAAVTDYCGNGVLYVFQHNGTDWNQMGSPFLGDVLGNATYHHHGGDALALNYNGDRLMFGDFHWPDYGIVSMFEWDGVAWIQMGSSITDFPPTDCAKMGPSGRYRELRVVH